MPVQIGASTHNFSNPTGLLSDCHRRVEMFMGALESVAAVCDKPVTAQARHSLDLALRYFREAAPKHTADEEESLFPVLRSIDDAALKAALGRLDALEADHRWAEPLHAEVDSVGLAYLQSGHLDRDQASRFKNAVRQLAEMYRRHIEVEDSQVFPAASRVLNEEQKKQIASEMAARRSVKVVSL